MITRTWLVGLSVAAAATCFGPVASAAPVVLSYEGRVSGHFGVDVSTGLPIGASVALTLAFDESFSDGSFSLSDPLRSVSGTMTAGGQHYEFNDAIGYTYWYDSALGKVTAATIRFFGTGPQIDGGDFFGLFLTMTSDLILADEALLGHGFSNPFGGTSYGYARLATERYDLRPAEVSAPPTLALAMMSLLVLGWTRRRA